MISDSISWTSSDRECLRWTLFSYELETGRFLLENVDNMCFGVLHRCEFHYSIQVCRMADLVFPSRTDAVLMDF